MVLVFAGAGAAVAGLFVLVRDRTPELTRAAFEESFDRWRERRLADYDIRVRVRRDTQPDEEYRVEVRGGRAVRETRNGTELARPRDAFTVDGLFAVIERDLEMAADPDPEPGARRGARLRAGFDPDLGVPLVFKALAADRRSLFLEVEELSVPGGKRILP